MTPSYKGLGQPSVGSENWLGTWLGGTPSYKNKPAPPTTANAMAASTPSSDCACPDDGPIAIVIPRDVIEQKQQ